MVDLAALARDLIAALPRCDVTGCSNPATRAFRRGESRWCDEHRHVRLHLATGEILDLGEAPEDPRAAPLRALVAALSEKETA